MARPQGYVQPVQMPPPPPLPAMPFRIPQAPPLPGVPRAPKLPQTQDALAKRVAALIRAQKGMPAVPAVKAPPALPQGFFKKAEKPLVALDLKKVLAQKALARKRPEEHAVVPRHVLTRAEIEKMYAAPKQQTELDKKLRLSKLNAALRKFQADQKAQKERLAKRGFAELVRERAGKMGHGAQAAQVRADYSGLAQLRQGLQKVKATEAVRAAILRQAQQAQKLSGLEKSAKMAELRMRAKAAGVTLPAAGSRVSRQQYEPLMAQSPSSVPRGVSGQSVQTAAQRFARLQKHGGFKRHCAISLVFVDS